MSWRAIEKREGDKEEEEEIKEGESEKEEGPKTHRW